MKRNVISQRNSDFYSLLNIFQTIPLIVWTIVVIHHSFTSDGVHESSFGSRTTSQQKAPDVTAGQHITIKYVWIKIWFLFWSDSFLAPRWIFSVIYLAPPACWADPRWSRPWTPSPGSGPIKQRKNASKPERRNENRPESHLMWNVKRWFKDNANHFQSLLKSN